MNDEKPAAPIWDPAFYGEGYYGKGSRGGFTSYDYNSPEQKKQLDLKWQVCGAVLHESALFVGCALGFEVAHWIERHKFAAGVDVSEWAIANQIPEAKGLCRLYDGRNLDCPDNHFDLVGCFDVLPHLPDGMREELVAEMVRVAHRGIVWRSHIKNWRNLDVAVDGQDGAWFRLQRFEVWDRLFTQSGKFRLETAKVHFQYETTAVYLRT